MRRFSLSLAQKVLIIFPLILIPILAVFLISYSNTKRNFERLLLDNLRTIAEEREGDILQFIEMTRDRAQDFASDGMIIEEMEKLRQGKGIDRSALSRYIVENKMPLSKNIYRIYVISNWGRIIASSLTSAIGEDVSGEEFFIKGRGGVSITENDMGALGMPELAVSAPIRGRDGTVLGIVAGFVPLSGIERIFSGEHLKELGAISWSVIKGHKTLDIYLVNRNRLMLTQSRFLRDAVLRQKVDTPPVNLCLEKGREMTGMYRDYAGVDVAGASMCFPQMRWTLLVEINREEIFAPVRKTARYAFATVAVTVGFIGVLVLYFLRIVVNQLRSLAAASREIASGNYDTYVPVKSSDEIGVLSESFNNMAREIKDRTEALRNSEERLRAIMDNTTNVVYLKDPDGRYILINRRYEVLFHVKREDIYGKTGYDIFPREIADKLRQNDLKALESGVPLEFEEDVTQDGEVHTYISIKFGMRDSKGAVYAVCGISTDITELKRSEEALKKSQESLANAQRIAHVGSWDWDIAKNKVYWSDELYRIYGEPLGREVSFDLFISHAHPGDRDLVTGSIDGAVKRGEPYSLEHRIIRVDGEVRVVLKQGEVVRDRGGRPVRISGTVQDITERKRAEELLRESERKYRTLVENALVGVYRITIGGKVLYLNEALARMFEFDSTGEAMTASPFEYYRSKEELEALIEMLKKQGKIDVTEGEGVTKRGNVRNFLFTATLEGDVVSGMVIDITERKRAEEEVRRLYEELEKRVVERTAELNAANKDLEAAYKELETFSYSVAHDLRTPLRLIDGFSHVLYDDYRDKIDLKGQDYLMRIRKASQRMGQLIDDLLELSRVSRAEMKKGKVSLSAIANSIASDLKKAEPVRKAEFVIEEGLVAHGDVRLLHVVLENLIRNAWKFTGKVETARIEFGSMGKEDDRTIYFVRDNGAGFNMAYAQRLFAPFQRLHSSDDFPGTGVGLATVARIIQRHGGRVWAEGAVGKGATFYFSI